MDDKQINQEVENLFMQLTQATHEHWDTVVKDFGLTASQALALRHLDESQPMRGLADKLVCDASYVTGLVDSLEQLGLVERNPDKFDRRIKNLVLTEKGINTRRELISRLSEESPIVAGLSANEKNVLRDILKSVVNHKA